MNMKNKSCLYARYVYQLYIHTLDVSKCESCSFAFKSSDNESPSGCFHRAAKLLGNVNGEGIGNQSLIT